jgi:hypothetical protein
MIRKNVRFVRKAESGCKLSGVQRGSLPLQENGHLV